jgi:hypothetical protein
VSKLTETDLIGIIKQLREDSLGAEDGDLSEQRATSMDHYHGRPYGNEVDGRSQVVSRDLAETVDWALPSILRAFVQSGSLAEFSPVGPEDEQLAQQESDYTNQVLMKDNPGFLVLHDAVKDTLLLKNGYVKHFWEEKEEVEEEEYTGLTLEALQKLLTDLESDYAEVVIKGQESNTVTVEGIGPVEFFDVRLQCKKKTGKLVWMAVPTEEVRVSKRCRGSLQDSPFTEHVTRKTRSELIELGIPRKFVDDLPEFNGKDQDSQQDSRNSVDDESDDLGPAAGDRSMDEIEFCEAYLRVDWDGDGIAELRKIVTCANKIPPGAQWNEQIPAVPMTGFVGKRIPHRHVGESLDDELADLQEIKTVLKRQLLDNIYLTNNSEKVVNERANLRDFMTTTPGGIKRLKGTEPVNGAWQPMVTPPIIDKILPAIDYIDRVKEVRTGIRPGADMDPDILRETTKGAYLEQLNRASQKIEMLTRLIAETGVKEAVLQAHSILVRHQNQARMVQLRGKWVQVNPREWKNRTDLTVKVGLGTGNEQEKREKLMLLWQLVGNLGPQGMVSPQNLYALFEDVAKTMGFDVPEKYVMSPSSEEFAAFQQQKAQQPNPEVQKAQMEIQAKAQIEQARMQMQAEVDRNRQEMEAQQQAARIQMEERMAQFKAQLETQLEERRMQFKAETDILIARINAQSKTDAAQVTAASTLTPEQEAASDGAADAQ